MRGCAACSAQLQRESGLTHDRADRREQRFDKLTEPQEKALIRRLTSYPELLEKAAQGLEPHQLAYYLRDLAGDFHAYYNAHKFIIDDAAIRNARLNLIAATRQVLANGLKLLGVSAPERMERVSGQHGTGDVRDSVNQPELWLRTQSPFASPPVRIPPTMPRDYKHTKRRAGGGSGLSGTRWFRRRSRARTDCRA